MLQIYHDRNKVQELLELWKEIKALGTADNSTKDTMLKIFHKRGKDEDLDTLFKEIRSTGNIHHITKNTMLKILYERERYDEAVDLFKTTQPVDIFIKTTMLQVYHKSNKTGELLALWEEIKASGRADNITKNVMLKIFHERERHTKVLDLWNEIKASGEAPIIIKNTMLKIFHEVGKDKEALDLWKEIEKSGNATSITKNIMLKIFHERGSYQEAVNLYNKMLSSGVVNIFIKTTMLQVYHKCNETEALFKLWKEIEESDADIVTKSTMINILNALGDYDESLKIFNQYFKMTEFDDTEESNILLNGVVQSYLGSKGLDAALKFFDEAQGFKSSAIKNKGKEDTLDSSKLRNVEGSTDMLKIDLHSRLYGIAKILVYKALCEAQENKKSLRIITGHHQRVLSKDQSMKQEIIEFLKSLGVPYKEDSRNQGSLTCLFSEATYSKTK